MTIPEILKDSDLDHFVRDLRAHRARHSVNDYTYANDILNISLNTYKKCIQSPAVGELSLQRSKLINILSRADLDPGAYNLNIVLLGSDQRFGNYQKSKFQYLCGRHLVYRRSFLTARDITCGVLAIAQSKVQDCLTFTERHQHTADPGLLQQREHRGDIYMDEGQALLSLPAYENGKVRLMQLVPERIGNEVVMRGALLAFASPKGIWQPTMSCVYTIGPIKDEKIKDWEICRVISDNTEEFATLSAHLEHVEHFTTNITPLMFQQIKDRPTPQG